ncbi:MAG: Blue-light-activated protein [Smithella sp. PtaU1.Bin162]|nr:MAG: Blue-light-activated protein [Smithella sp. PtaU1.Bin162]
MGKEKKTNKQPTISKSSAEKFPGLNPGEQKFAKAFLENSTPIAITTIQEGKFIDVNNALCEMIGYAMPEIIGKTTIETGFITAEKRELLLNELKNKRHVKNLELQIKTKSGKVKCGLLNSNKIVLDGGEYLLTVITDITNQRWFEEDLQRSRNLMMEMLELSGSIICIKDTEGRYELVNRRWEEVTGFKREQALGKTSEELFPNATGRQMYLNDREVMQSGKMMEKEEVLESTGGKRYFLSIKFPFGGGNGFKGGLCVIIREITERKQAEEALKKSEKLYRTFIDASSDMVFLKDESLRNIVVNKSLEEFFGKPEEEIIGKTDFELMPQAAAEKCRETDLKAKEMNSTVISKETVGQYVYESLKFPVSLGEGRTGVGGFIRDITLRTKAESALRESERKFRDLAEKSIVGIYLLQDGLFRYVNSELANIFGYDADKIIDRLGVRDVIFPDDIPQVEENLRRRISGELKSLRYSFRVLTKNKEIRYAEVFSSRTVYQGKPAVIGTLMDITDRRRVEEELKRLSIAIEQADEDVVITDPEGVIQYVNPAFEKITGYSRTEAIGRTPRILKSGIHQPDFYRELWNTIKGGHIWKGTVTNRRKDGKLIEEDATISPLLSSAGTLTGYVALKRDVTNARKIEVQLRQSQKMEAIGVLAGGIAHDFNNILGAMMGYAELAFFKTSDKKINPYLEQILKSCDRARDLVKQILTFSRQREQEKKFVSVTPIVKEALKLLRSSLPATIEIIQTYEVQRDVIICDPTHIHQVLMNLCTNALHAMREQGGVLKIFLQEQEFATDNMYNLDLKKGAYLQLIVSDTGTGIDPDIIDKIFDPFFTTKQLGEGTGLGLSVVYGIVKDAGGVISVESEPGKGTKFTIYLPLIDSNKRTDEQKDLSVPHGNGCILYVDDEESIAALGREMLTPLGYEVIVCVSSSDALNIFRNDPQRFDLIITDMTMPNMTGIALAKEMIKIRPEIPIILSTGFSEQITEEESGRNGIREFLMKPVSLPALAQAVKRAMGQAESATV